jgi:hypothetical protein
MTLLRRVLYLQAAVWAIAGVSLAVLPHFVLVTLFNQIYYPDYAWVRIVGLQTFALAMLMVLVAQRAVDVWWWSWAFLFPTGLIAVVAALNVTLSLPNQSAPELWWLIAAVHAALLVGLFWGIARTARERPLP